MRCPTVHLELTLTLTIDLRNSENATPATPALANVQTNSGLSMSVPFVPFVFELSPL